MDAENGKRYVPWLTFYLVVGIGSIIIGYSILQSTNAQIGVQELRIEQRGQAEIIKSINRTTENIETLLRGGLIEHIKPSLKTR